MSAPKKPRRKWTQQEIEKCLHVLAWENGSAIRSIPIIEEQFGISVPKPTLISWKNQLHRDRYHQIREEVIPKIRARAAESAMSLAEEQAEVSAQILHRIRDELPEIPARDLAGALRNVETSKAINLDKHQVLTGAPTSVVEHRSLRDLVHGLEKRGVIRIQDAEVVEHDELPPGPPSEDDSEPERKPGAEGRTTGSDA